MNKAGLIIISLCLVIFAVGCTATPAEPRVRAALSSDSQKAIEVFKAKDPAIQKFFDSSYGYAVLPKIFKGAFWVGGAHGKGIVYERGTKIGYCNMSQATLGFSFGGEFFREIIFFQTRQDLDKFRTSEFTFSAQATAVALTTGAAAKASYNNGMAVFIAHDTGLMVDASLGGQKFYFDTVPIITQRN